MSNRSIDASRLLAHIAELGGIGRNPDGKLARLAASDTDRLGRDKFVTWLKDAGLDVAVDRIGNIFGIWSVGAEIENPVMIGSHIDTVINAGIYDGCYGVLSGLEVIQTLRQEGFKPSRRAMELRRRVWPGVSPCRRASRFPARRRSPG